MLVTGYNALEVDDDDILQEVIDINETCYNICHLRYITVTNIHMSKRLCQRVRDLVSRNYFRGQSIRELIETKGNFLYLKLDGSETKIKIQEKCGNLTLRPWWLTVSPIVNKGDRVFKA